MLSIALLFLHDTGVDIYNDDVDYKGARLLCLGFGVFVNSSE